MTHHLIQISNIDFYEKLVSNSKLKNLETNFGQKKKVSTYTRVKLKKLKL